MTSAYRKRLCRLNIACQHFRTSHVFSSDPFDLISEHLISPDLIWSHPIWSDFILSNFTPFLIASDRIFIFISCHLMSHLTWSALTFIFISFHFMSCHFTSCLIWSDLISFHVFLISFGLVSFFINFSFDLIWFHFHSMPLSFCRQTETLRFWSDFKKTSQRKMQAAKREKVQSSPKHSCCSIYNAFHKCWVAEPCKTH